MKRYWLLIVVLLLLFSYNIGTIFIPLGVIMGFIAGVIAEAYFADKKQKL
jgi:hypothetical protein